VSVLGYKALKTDAFRLTEVRQNGDEREFGKWNQQIKSGNFNRYAL